MNFDPDVHSLLTRWLESAREGHHDIIIAGEIIGGRHGEAMQRPVAFQLMGAILVIRFDGTERLTVSDPGGIGLDEWGGLQISRASEARYGHHYYGRPQTPENWIETIFRNRKEMVEIITLGSLLAGVRTIPLPDNPFVRIV